ncbi:YehR family lipoprotein [Planococcus sp. YIM B11945]|uniref:YehR family lipoprotein n=1 Tax=Planococcus sp. YIM B11945 TaxID=3435410 RepID=UPI003D7C76C3
MAVLLTACSGGSESTKTFELDKDGVLTTMVYTAKGDKVTKQTTENVIQYELAGIESKEQAQQLLDPMVSQFQNIDGVTHKLEYEDTKAIETLAIDYEVVNIDDIEGLPGMSFSEGAKDQGISLEKSEELLESQGFKEVE